MRQDSTSRAPIWIALACTGLVFCGIDSAAANQRPGRLAEVRFTEKAIAFEPVVEFERLELIVSGPGVLVSRSFKRAPVLRFAELADGGAPDGSYTYELRRVPRVDPDVRPLLDKARSLGDERAVNELCRGGKLPRGPFVQSGSFTLVDGLAVDPGVPEKQASRPPAEEGALRVAGDLEVEGAKKFRMIDPADEGREILFAALEGPEVGTYFRGSGRLMAGEAVVKLPSYFGRVTEADRLTVQLTPIGGWSQLYVAELTAERLVVRAAGDAGDGRFDFLIQGVRKGFSDFAVDRDATGGER